MTQTCTRSQKHGASPGRRPQCGPDGLVSSCEAQAHSTTSFDSTLQDALKGTVLDRLLYFFRNLCTGTIRICSTIPRRSAVALVKLRSSTISSKTEALTHGQAVKRCCTRQTQQFDDITRNSGRGSSTSCETRSEMHFSGIDLDNQQNFFHDLWYRESRSSDPRCTGEPAPVEGLLDATESSAGYPNFTSLLQLSATVYRRA